MESLLKRLLDHQPGVFVDVGVNLGQTLVKVKACDPLREYVGFEPNPQCVAYVQSLVKANHFRNCVLLPVGLFTADRVLALHLFSGHGHDPSASMIENFRQSSQSATKIFVPVFRFESVASHLGSNPVGIVKIDVEGAELEVIQSLENLIKRDHPVILIEVLPAYSNTNTARIERQNQLVEIFSAADYVMLRIEKTAANTLSGLKHVKEIEVHSSIALCDYVVVPRKQHAALQAAFNSYKP